MLEYLIVTLIETPEDLIVHIFVNAYSMIFWKYLKIIKMYIEQIILLSIYIFKI